MSKEGNNRTRPLFLRLAKMKPASAQGEGAFFLFREMAEVYDLSMTDSQNFQYARKMIKVSFFSWLWYVKKGGRELFSQ